MRLFPCGYLALLIHCRLDQFKGVGGVDVGWRKAKWKRGDVNRGLKKLVFSWGFRLIFGNCLIPFRSRGPIGLLPVRNRRMSFFLSGYIKGYLDSCSKKTL